MSKTKFEECCETIINVFHQYSVRVGHFDMLSKGEFKQFVEKELPSYLKNQEPKKKAVIDELFAKFDKNKDQNMSFTEFLSFLSLVLGTKHEQIHEEHHHH